MIENRVLTKLFVPRIDDDDNREFQIIIISQYMNYIYHQIWLWNIELCYPLSITCTTNVWLTSLRFFFFFKCLRERPLISPRQRWDIISKKMWIIGAWQCKWICGGYSGKGNLHNFACSMNFWIAIKYCNKLLQANWITFYGQLFYFIFGCRGYLLPIHIHEQHQFMCGEARCIVYKFL